MEEKYHEVYTRYMLHGVAIGAGVVKCFLLILNLFVSKQCHSGKTETRCLNHAISTHFCVVYYMCSKEIWFFVLLIECTQKSKQTNKQQQVYETLNPKCEYLI